MSVLTDSGRGVFLRTRLLLSCGWLAGMMACATPSHYAQGKAFAKEQNWEEAVRHYKMGLNAEPKNGALWLALGMGLGRLGDWAGAENAIDRAITFGKGVRGHWTLGRLRRKQERHREAAEHLQKAVELGGKDPDLHRELAAVWEALGDRDKTLESLNQVAKAEPQNDFDVTLTRARLMAKDDPVEAVALLKKTQAGRRGQELARVYVVLGQVYEELEDFEPADLHFRKALNIAPGLVGAVIGRARSQCRTGELGEGVGALNAAMRKHRDNPELTFAMALCYLNFGMKDRAVAFLMRTLEIDSQWVDAYPHLLTLLEGAPEAQRAAVLGQAAAALPRDVGIQMDHARMAASRGEHQKVIAACQAVLDVEPAHKEANYLLGLAQHRSGETEAARETLEALTVLDAQQAQKLDQAMTSSPPKVSPTRAESGIESAKKKKKKRKGKKRKRRRRRR